MFKYLHHSLVYFAAKARLAKKQKLHPVPGYSHVFVSDDKDLVLMYHEKNLYVTKFALLDPIDQYTATSKRPMVRTPS